MNYMGVAVLEENGQHIVVRVENDGFGHILTPFIDGPFDNPGLAAERLREVLEGGE